MVCSRYVFFYQMPKLPEFFMRMSDLKLFEMVFRKHCNDEELEAFKYTFAKKGKNLSKFLKIESCLNLNPSPYRRPHLPHQLLPGKLWHPGSVESTAGGRSARPRTLPVGRARCVHFEGNRSADAEGVQQSELQDCARGRPLSAAAQPDAGEPGDAGVFGRNWWPIKKFIADNDGRNDGTCDLCVVTANVTRVKAALEYVTGSTVGEMLFCCFENKLFYFILSWLIY